jgi:hypothetical protein
MLRADPSQNEFAISVIFLLQWNSSGNAVAAGAGGQTSTRRLLRTVSDRWQHIGWKMDPNKINAIPQIARLAPVEDRLGDIRGEIAEADDPSEVRPADAFALGKRGKGNAVSAEECRVEPACSGHQLAAAGCPRDDEERPRQQGRIVLIQRAREDLEADVDPAAGETRPARAAWPLVAKSASVKSATPCG